MNVQPSVWQPYSPHSWASIMGLVYVPMFRPQAAEGRGEHAILLDGPRGSFALSRTDDRDLLFGDLPLSWAWSAHVRHALLIDRQREQVYLRRWDSPGLIRRFRVPRGQDATDLLRVMEQSPGPRTPDAVQRVLHLFRLLRQALPGQGDDALWSVRVMDALLVAAARVRRGRLKEDHLRRCRSLEDAFHMLTTRERRDAGVEDPPRSIASRELGVLLDVLLEPEPASGCTLHPDLLLRHASSELYQEAHLEIERGQLSLPGLGSVEEPKGKAPRDVRFTPPNLARALTQQAIEALGPLPDHLVATDPACGSGVFLRECIRELLHRGYRGSLDVVGYDISRISQCMTEFCLRHVRADLPPHSMRVHMDVAQRDSLKRRPWRQADLILMNPPFIPFEALTEHQKQSAAEVLGDLAQYRYNYATAFVAEAAEALKPNGVLACVLPAPLLSNDSGRPLREHLAMSGNVLLLGRFEGYRYFPTSLVETAFLLYQKAGPAVTRPPSIEIIIANEGREDASLRSLRLPPDGLGTAARGIDRYRLDPDNLQAANWRPVRHHVHEFIEALRERHLPNVDALFDVREGVRLGARKALTISADGLALLPRRERKFFRPAVGTESVGNGRLLPLLHVFYPYGEAGLLIRSEDQLQECVPQYYSQVLKPNYDTLRRRASLRRRNWWELCEPRAWQYRRSPRLLSTYFGESGSFAYDTQGDYVVVNGHAWCWKRGTSGRTSVSSSFHSTRLPWAYLAVLNSPLFERILACFCTRLQGGQMRLEKRFVGKIPIVDLGTDKGGDPTVLQQLTELGREIHAGKLSDVRTDLDSAVAAAYGLPLESCSFR